MAEENYRLGRCIPNHKKSKIQSTAEHYNVNSQPSHKSIHHRQSTLSRGTNANLRPNISKNHYQSSTLEGNECRTDNNNKRELYTKPDVNQHDFGAGCRQQSKVCESYQGVVDWKTGHRSNARPMNTSALHTSSSGHNNKSDRNDVYYYSFFSDVHQPDCCPLCKPQCSVDVEESPDSDVGNDVHESRTITNINPYLTTPTTGHTNIAHPDIPSLDLSELDTNRYSSLDCSQQSIACGSRQVNNEPFLYTNPKNTPDLPLPIISGHTNNSQMNDVSYYEGNGDCPSYDYDPGCSSQSTTLENYQYSDGNDNMRQFYTTTDIGFALPMPNSGETCNSPSEDVKVHSSKTYCNLPSCLSDFEEVNKSPNPRKIFKSKWTGRELRKLVKAQCKLSDIIEETVEQLRTAEKCSCNKLPRGKVFTKDASTQTDCSEYRSRNTANMLADEVKMRDIDPLINKLEQMNLRKLKDCMAIMEDLERVPQEVSKIYKALREK